MSSRMIEGSRLCQPRSHLTLPRCIAARDLFLAQRALLVLLSLSFGMDGATSAKPSHYGLGHDHARRTVLTGRCSGSLCVTSDSTRLHHKGAASNNTANLAGRRSLSCPSQLAPLGITQRWWRNEKRELSSLASGNLRDCCSEELLRLRSL